MNLKAVKKIVAFMVLALCIPLYASTEEYLKEYEAKEDSVQYPFEAMAVYHKKLCKVTFTSKDTLILEIPKHSKNYMTEYTWKPSRTLKTWKKNCQSMRTVGIELEVVRTGDGYKDNLQFCRKGNFLMPIFEKLDWTVENYLSRADVEEFFQYDTEEEMEHNTFDPSWHSVPALAFENLDDELKEERHKQNEWQW